MKQKIKKGIAMLLGMVLTVATCISALPQMAITAYAEGEKTISGLGTGAIANPTSGAGGWSKVYYGAYDTDNDGTAEPVKYRVLDKAATEFGGTTMLLDCDSTLISMPHDSLSPYSNSWADSEIKAWLNGNKFYNSSGVFTTQEKDAIAASSKSDFSNDGQGRYHIDPQNLNGEHVFLLDAKEATRESYGYASVAGTDGTRVKSGTNLGWWLRSPVRDYGSSAGFVRDYGYVYDDNVDNDHGVSPAFNINLESVIFSSVISGSAGEAGAEYKLTIADDNMNITPGTITRDGTTITVPYTITGTNAGNANRVSVLITDSQYSAGTAVTSGYTYLKLSGDTSGSGTFTLPAAYADKTCGTDYYAYILAEVVNTGNATDYASVPTSITIPSTSKPTLTITAKDITLEYIGQTQGPGDATYYDPAEIAEMVTVTGLQDGDTLTSITVDGQGKEVGDYELTPSGAAVNNESASNKYDVTYVKGKFTITSPTYSVMVTNDGNGTASASATSTTAGTEITLTATPNSGYAFKEWQVVSGSVTITDNKFTMPASDVGVKAIFEALPPSSYSVTMTNDGHGSATANPASGATGTTVTIKATPNSGYQFEEWQVQSGGATLADASSATTTFEIKNANVTIKAIFEKKSGGSSSSNDDNDSDDDSDDSGSKPKDEKPFDYLDELRAKLKTAIDLGGEQTVIWDKGTALPYDIMKTLQDNPNITLVFSYTYENVDFKVKLNGKTVKAYTTIPWYGPLYLYAYYGGRGAVQNAPVANANRTYTVVKGDTLTGIAIKLNTSVRHLVSLNSIKDPDKIKIGQVLKY